MMMAVEMSKCWPTCWWWYVVVKVVSAGPKVSSVIVEATVIKGLQKPEPPIEY